MNAEGPKETIISVALENRILRWMTLILTLGMTSSGILSYQLSKKPAKVWLVMEDGRIANDEGQLFEWNVHEAAQRAVEAFYVPGPDREKILGKYFTEFLAEAGRKHIPADKFVLLRINKVERKDNEIHVDGILLREKENDLPLRLILIRSERSEENPFGLIVSSSTKAGG